MKCLEFPFDNEYIINMRKSIRRDLISADTQFIGKKIAILGGSTTSLIKNILELFLLKYGIKPEFYESEYAQYWQDAMFNDKLESFKPDVIFIHTTSRNITMFPSLKDNAGTVDDLLDQQFSHFSQMWDRLLTQKYCVIQNNFERPVYRLLGNKDVSDYHGRSNFVMRLNKKLYEYSQKREGFFVNDIDYLSASYGLEKWLDFSHWYMYKYALSMQAIPELAFSVSNIVKSIYGGNKKALVLDLDNTLWGGIIGDEGIENIKLGQDDAEGEAYAEFQEYLKSQIDLGILLTICSKNDLENAIIGLEHSDSRLSPGDFATIKASWENKDHNILKIADELNISTNSLVFIDDNPAERMIVSEQIPDVLAPDINGVENYIRTIDKSGFFEATAITGDDLLRSQMYRENALRTKQEQRFENYKDYLSSLEMTAEIRDFDSVSIPRIAQLINKTNQFNLTTKRYSENEVKAIFSDDNYIRLSGRLKDRFGDNGIVSVIIGHKNEGSLHIDLWLMSCRVFKRDMELAMMDALVKKCCELSIKHIVGYYYPSKKNKIVAEHYGDMCFTKTFENEGKTVWVYDINNYKQKNHVIKT